MASEDVAARALEDLGLTEYEAKCFVALTRVPNATAKEISQLADVPRSRVYDTVERLNKRGLVDMQQSEPRRFRAVSVDEALDKLRREYDDSIDAAEDALDRVSAAEPQEDKGVWVIAEAEHVTDRMLAQLEDAENHAHFIIADKSVVHQAALEELDAASDRGVSVLVEVPTESIQESVREIVSDACVVVSDGLAETQQVVKKWPGQLLMVDHRSVLASGVEQSDLPGVKKETAVWSQGHDHGFATWVRELLSDRISAVE